ncbi:NrfD/PsrC family molybdoenzyme membrane anchor subunit [Senegalimassilia anaerobia]|uniref:NrfD/PsrC family molybdoenzyme membrane anchor subunit n=1 Tax=Senegalimassilia anaerobia TaxID=1473216 RepID=UPI0026EC1A1A|nr:NrfD/PsrC family molybdoenzyme membrane anchor subunit [Senegalimassilia anaerobia]
MIWDWIIALYLFLAGMGAGAFVLGVIAGWKCPDASKVKLAGLVIAPVAVGVGTLMLMVDARAGLMNPLRFFGLLANPSSIMMWGVVLLSAFLLVGVVELALQWKTKKTPKWLDVVGVLLAVGVAGYTGMLLGDAHLAFPLWNQMVLPLLFLVSAASAGFAAVVLAGHALHAPELEQLRFTHTTGLVLPVLEAALIAVLLMMAQAADGSAAAAGAASVAALTSGAYAAPFWLGLVVVGLACPFALELAMRAKPELAAGPAAYVAECCVLVGGFMLRFLVIYAAVAVAVA